MIKIDIYEDKFTGRVKKYKVSGHADSTKVGEFDTVCALVSMTTQIPILGLERHLQHKISYKTDEVLGILIVELVDDPTELTEAILKTMYYGLIELQENFKDFIHIQKHRG
jgi:uncharacterized protein YsxB (DUF464 family)